MINGKYLVTLAVSTALSSSAYGQSGGESEPVDSGAGPVYGQLAGGNWGCIASCGSSGNSGSGNGFLGSEDSAYFDQDDDSDRNQCLSLEISKPSGCYDDPGPISKLDFTSWKYNIQTVSFTDVLTPAFDLAAETYATKKSISLAALEYYKMGMAICNTANTFTQKGYCQHAVWDATKGLYPDAYNLPYISFNLGVLGISAGGPVSTWGKDFADAIDKHAKCHAWHNLWTNEGC